jgi:hypothetical protein
VTGNIPYSSEGLEAFILKKTKRCKQENWKGVNQEIGTDDYRTKIASVFE